MMALLTSPDPQEDAAKEAVIAALLPCLADLLDLAGNAKLAHWNVRGHCFKEIHEALDALVDAARLPSASRAGQDPRTERLPWGHRPNGTA